MKLLKRKMETVTEVKTGNDNIDICLPHCQASFNSDGNITLRNYDRSDKSKDELFILSNSETEALFALFSKLGQKNKSYDLPF